MLNSVKFKNKTLQVPIIQGGMGAGISLGNLAGSVMKEGCMGVISAAHTGYKYKGFNEDSEKTNLIAINAEIKKARKISQGSGLLGINIMVASMNYEEYVKTAVKAKVDVIISGAGLPLSLPKFVDDKDILLAPIVSSGRAINLICKVWDKRYNTTPDFVVIEGSKAGGHLGFKKEDLENDTCESLEDIFFDVKKELKLYEEKFHRNIPVFIAGGIYNGKDIAHFLNLGASGVQMATRFIATYECDAHDKFKQAVINVKKEDIAFVKSPTGFPGRAIKNEFIKKTQKRGNICMKNCYHCLSLCNPSDTPYCISTSLINAAKGDIDNGLVFVGSNAYKLDKIISVKELIYELKNESSKYLGEVI